MKCVLCNYQNNQLNDLKEHYLKDHNVNENNVFFKKLINEKRNIIHRKKCNYCNEFVLNKAEHNFLKHYGRGTDGDDDDDDDNLPVAITYTGDITKLEITFKEHSSYYNFFDSVAVVDSFLAQIKRLVKRYDNNVLIRMGFSIENVQQALDNYSKPLVQTRYWSTEHIQSKSFNDFISFKSRESILKRVINNGLTGSTWNFNKFNYLNVKILRLLKKQLMK